MFDRSFAKAGLAALALTLTALPPASALATTATPPLAATLLAQQDRQASGDQTSGETSGQPANDQEALDNGPAFTNEPSPTASQTAETPSGQPANDIETLDNGPASTNEPPIPTTETAPAPAAAPAPSGQSEATGQAPAAPSEAAAPAPTQTPEMTAAQFFAMPHPCVVAQAGRAYAAVNCNPNMQVQVGFAPLGGPPPFAISTGSTNGTMAAPQMAPPPAAPSAAEPTPTPEPSSTGSAQSNSPTTRKGSKTSANGNGASTQSSEPVITFSGPQGTVKRVGNATIVTGASQDSEQQSVHNANGKAETSNQSGASNQKAGNIAAAKHAAKKHGKHGKKHGKHKKHNNKKKHKNNNKSKKNNGNSKSSAGKRSGGNASAGNGGSAHAEANGGAITVGGDNPSPARTKPKKANGT